MGHRRLLCWSLGLAVLLVSSLAAAQPRVPPPKPNPAQSGPPGIVIRIPRLPAGSQTPPKSKPRQTPPARPRATPAQPPPFVLPGPMTLPQLPPIVLPQIPGPSAPQASPPALPRPGIIIRVPQPKR